MRKRVGGDSLVGSAPTYSAVMLRMARVQIPTQGPFPILPPSLSLSLPLLLSVNSKLSCLHEVKNAKKYIQLKKGMQ